MGDGLKSTLLSWKASSEEFGPAKIGFLMTPLESSRTLLIVTFWITVKGYEKHDPTFTKILDSIKPLKRSQ